MNPRDRRNIEFILGLTGAQTRQWIRTLSPDDVAYALEIVDARLLALYQKRTGLIEQQLATMTSFPQVEQLLRNLD